MKKKFISLFLALSLISFTACGLSDSKVTGITAGIVNYDSDSGSYSQECVDGSTLTDNDYLIRIGERYQLVVKYSFCGGSRAIGFADAENVKVIFDNDLLQLGEPSEKGGNIYFPIECKKEFTYSAILIEVDEEYHTEVIVSATA